MDLQNVFLRKWITIGQFWERFQKDTLPADTCLLAPRGISGVFFYLLRFIPSPKRNWNLDILSWFVHYKWLEFPLKAMSWWCDFLFLISICGSSHTAPSLKESYTSHVLRSVFPPLCGECRPQLPLQPEMLRDGPGWSGFGGVLHVIINVSAVWTQGTGKYNASTFSTPSPVKLNCGLKCTKGGLPLMEGVMRRT